MTVDDSYVLQDSDYPAIPKQLGYRGAWNKYTSPVTKDITIQATYTEFWHTVTFIANGVTVKTMQVREDDVLKDADYPEIPVRIGYVSSWNKYTSPITDNITIQASYMRSDHMVRFIDDGTLVKYMMVGHGYVLKDWDYPELPEVEGYQLTWLKYTEPITADVVIWANRIPQYTVTFVADGITVKTLAVASGYVLSDGDYPAVPEKAGCHGEWNRYTSPITENITIQATYHIAYRRTVTFVADGVTVTTITVEDGYVLTDADYPTVPEKSGYRGTWKRYTSPITSNITIQAVYEASIPVPTLPTDPGNLMSLEDEETSTPTETSEDPEATTDVEPAANEAAVTASTPALELVSAVTERHSYIYAGERLLRETITTTAADGTVTTEVLDFTYDAQGRPYMLTYTNGVATKQTYYYITNLQGDVEELIDSNGDLAADYNYDPYGQVQLAYGAIAKVNPLRYRGYYCDIETGFYYLQSRYYDPEICRFVNFDKYASTGQGYLGYSMFTYCNNNPVNSYDPAGSRAMGPSFVCCNDGGYASQYIVPPKPQEGSQEPTPESEVLNYYV